uniref:Om n=1 Tax=Nannochloropsis oceanica TaxID=145522 RepID=A0A1S7C7R3_9STRA|nr:Om [Nannochloropsis oceanica]
MVEQTLPTLSQIKKAIPEKCFQKSLLRSFYYMLRDFAALAALYFVYPTVQAKYGLPGLFVWWNLAGFFMWCLFVIGHDCGHGSFSEYKWLNDICGHICHAPLMVPYWPWQKSHRLHHMYHNHLTKDMSHPWMTKEVFEDLTPFEQALLENPLSLFIKYTFLYLFAGKMDGSHVVPFSPLFTDTKERVQCAVSTLGMVVAGALVYIGLEGGKEGGMARIGSIYVVPLLVFNAWITMVTYLQHHDEDTKVYAEGEWNYIKGALETIDREYGMGIDDLSHNITDGHVAHHLFFTQIPHYHLTAATAAVRQCLQPTGTYKKRRSWNFLARFTELNYRLKYVAGQGVLSYVDWEVARKTPASAVTSSSSSSSSSSLPAEAAVKAAAAVPVAAVAAPVREGRPTRKRSPTRSSSPP